MLNESLPLFFLLLHENTVPRIFPQINENKVENLEIDNLAGANIPLRPLVRSLELLKELASSS